MNFSKFWTLLSKSGVTPCGNSYSINSKGGLHILSPGNSNKSYNITKNKAEEYFDILQNGIMTEQEFKVRRSAYFFDVYSTLV